MGELESPPLCTPDVDGSMCRWRAGGVVRIDDGEPGAEQCDADAAALGVGMDAEGLQVPDRLVEGAPARGRPIARTAGITGGRDGSAQPNAGVMQAAAAGSAETGRAAATLRLGLIVQKRANRLPWTAASLAAAVWNGMSTRLRTPGRGNSTRCWTSRWLAAAAGQPPRRRQRRADRSADRSQ